MRRLAAWVRKRASLLIVLAVIVGLYSASTWQDARTRAAQQHQGQLIERKLCATLDETGADQPPPLLRPTDPYAAAVNPGRRYDERLHARLASLGPDIRCPGRQP